MTNVLILNGHLQYSYSQGTLTASLIERAESFFLNKGWAVKTTITADSYDVAAEIEKFKWADVVLLQMPLNWMGMPWSLKKYVDDVWGAGMAGEMSLYDGRSSEDPKKNYGTGGLLKGRYMLSVTANSPQEAFSSPSEHYFAGRSEDDLLLPIHLLFKWVGLGKVESFWSYDVMKNPQIEQDFVRFDNHLNLHF
ncbi:NAD(P)H-dependent oxidoreductase [Pectobacterium polaris]|uniref:NAD(P)H-dependent oxidoreductase n=1 Tax=Pectobacterium polaris TaxID=2042057 RepID=A0AAW4P688_9GAMM|nr:NAD(P)H-dependent oxidoreductase [Pectobacterium polaris]ASY80428.1 flavodoxin [Pectobacterium polaris]MBW5894805.1 NAD(P)H-dependent oxidoreductase [Pectobacterium polaris]MCA6941639.1 NAD(P)H-dependent oxidoreductase [Pectobacterium polaris]MCA6958624.1 NAD(P)H-dependent oxidoreductase [Pectobacterium polaris]MCL6362387.1 flavodoxin family protein [Pectobacterium polaris]